MLLCSLPTAFIWGQNPCLLDTIAPVVTCRTTTLYLNGLGQAVLTPQQIDANSTDNCGIANYTVDSLTQIVYSCIDVGLNSVVLMVTDSAGNSATCVATVTIGDNIAPIATCRANAVVYLNGSGQVTLLPQAIDAGSTDNCGIVDYRIDGVAQKIYSCVELGTNVTILTVSDSSGNTSSCAATVTVMDTITPTIVCAPVVYCYLDSIGQTTVAADSVATSGTDNCGFVSYTLNGVSVDTFTIADLGIRTITVTITDGAGNTDTCQTTLIVGDTIPPTVVCLDTVIYLDSNGLAVLTPSWVHGGSFDITGHVGLQVNGQSSILLNPTDVGTVVVLLTALDLMGNPATCLANVTVIDTFSNNTAFTLRASLQQNVTVFPNPAKEQFTVSTSKGLLRNVYLSNSVGQTVWELRDIERTQLQIPTQQLPQGLYLLNITTDQGQLTKKVLIK